MDRRGFLTLILALAVAPLARARAATQHRRAAYDVDAGILYNTLTFTLTGTVEETLDRAAGRYEVQAVGQGSRISNRLESQGVWREGRWAPLRATSWFQVAGRESRSELAYDYERRTVEYHYRGETFFLRRRRVADDVVAIPEGVRVDDALSAVLNYEEGRWPPESDGTYRSYVVRRRRPQNEKPDDVQKFYRAELVPLVLEVVTDPESGKPGARFDLTRFSSWAREDQPARIVFDPHRRPESITASLVLGTSISIRIKNAA